MGNEKRPQAKKKKPKNKGMSQRDIYKEVRKPVPRPTIKQRDISDYDRQDVNTRLRQYKNIDLDDFDELEDW